MTFKQVLSRLTGVSCSVFGAQWNPPEAEISIAKRVITFLEDRRVLYNDYDWECPDHCVRSIIEIRHFLTDELGKLTYDNCISPHLQAMRAACRKFLDAIQANGRGHIIRPFDGGMANWQFCSALGEFRANMGFRIAVLAVMYGLSINGDLEKILPPKPEKADAVTGDFQDA